MLYFLSGGQNNKGPLLYHVFSEVVTVPCSYSLESFVFVWESSIMIRDFDMLLVFPALPDRSNGLASVPAGTQRGQTGRQPRKQRCGLQQGERADPPLIRLFVCGH